MSTTTAGPLAELREVFTAPGPVLTLCLDVSRDNEDGDTEVGLRWRALREEAAAAGAPEDVLARVDEAITAPTGMGGGWGRTMVASAEGVLLDRLTRGRPDAYAAWALLPRLLPLAAADSSSVSYLVARVDRTGADLDVSARDGSWQETVEGDAEPVHKVRGGGWSHLRWQHNVENVWERNAAEVAERIERIAARTGVEVVALAGDPRAVAAVREALPPRVTEVHVLDGGGRGDKMPDGRLPLELDAVLQAYAAGRAREAAERFEEEQGRHMRAAAGAADVVAALRRAQVETLLVPTGWASTAPGWCGADPLTVGLTAAEVRALGAEPAQAPLDDLILRAVVATDAALLVVPPHILDLADRPAALLRFTDASTPHHPLPGGRTGS